MTNKVVLSRTEIENAYAKRNLNDAADLLGVSVVTLRKRMAEKGMLSHSNGWRPATAIDKDLLIAMYQDHQVPEIAEILHVDRKTVYARMREYGIKLRRQGPIRTFSPPRDELAELYSRRKWSMREIAKHYSVGETVVFRRLSEFGLANSKADRERTRKRALADKVARLTYSAKAWRKAVLKRDGNKCVKCGVEAGVCKSCMQHVFLQTHHIKTTKTHPALRFTVSNGMTLCRSCHAKEHRKQIG